MSEPGAQAASAPVAQRPARRRRGLGRDLRLVLATAGFTSLIWLVAGGFWLSSLRDAPDRPARAPLAEQSEAPSTDMVDTDIIAAENPSMHRPRQARPPGAVLAVPVAGVTPDRLTDTFTDSRAGGGRSHDAIDILAAAGTPVFAAAPGTVERLFLSDAGGKTVYIRSPDRNWTYYYAHLQDWAPDLREGQSVRAGDRLGTVGSSGNADPGAPHLHFAVMRMAAGEAWYEGTPVNPYPLLTGRARQQAAP